MSSRRRVWEPPELARLLAPRSVAVVGASERPGSYGAETILNLEAIGFGGEVWGVNPGRTRVFGRPCVPGLDALPGPVDAVVVAIPAAAAVGVIDQAGEFGCGGAVVFSAGFAEIPEGVELERDLVETALAHDLPVCGPNCNGIVSAASCCALWGDALHVRDPGDVALISQSGNIAVNALAAQRGLRFHTVIASGNQAVVAASDYLKAMLAQDGVRAVALYLEDDGGPVLCEALAAAVDAGVPVAVLKVGSSELGARAAAAHSAALAGDQRVFRSVIRDAGAVWAEDVHELLELAKTLAVRRSPLRSGALAIMTCSGGDSAQGADEARRLQLDLPALAPSTTQRLRELLPPAATVANPLDYTAMIWGDNDRLRELVRVMGEDPAIEQVLVFYDQPPALEGAAADSWNAVRDGLVQGAAASPVPVLIASTLPELLDDAAAWRCAQAGIPAVAGLRAGIRCAAAMAQPGGDSARLREIAAAAARLVNEDGGAGGGEWLAEHEAKALLQELGVPVPRGRVVNDSDDAVAALGELGPSVALKLSGPEIRHKSELGAVALGLDSEEAVRRSFGRLAALARDHHAVVLVEEMAGTGVELLVAGHREGIVPALVVGAGGIWTELLDDVAVVPLPATGDRIEEALRSLRIAAMLTGGRGGAVFPLRASTELIARVGELLLEGEVELIELNPVRVLAGTPVALDACVRRRVRTAAEVSGMSAKEPSCTT